MSKKVLLEKCEMLGIKSQKHLSKEKLVELIASREKTFTQDLGGAGQAVAKVYHLADIHIRVMDRHEEYKEVFQRLYEFLKAQENISSSVIVICGDLFHNKDRFVSETILLFNDFVKSLSEITTTFLIVGNHDCFHHTDRLDSLSGIIDIANHPNLHLLKNSGVYTFKNIQFGVSSLTDSMFIPSDKLDSKLIKIALYHGCVGNVDTGSGSFMKGMDINKFKGYDLCLLGDIHKRQYLNKEKTMAYPGSLIQQNHAEELSHGILVWDLEDRENFTSEFIEIPNDYSFMTIEVGETLDLAQMTFSKYSRVRLLIDNVEDVDIEFMSKELEKHTKVLSLKKLLKPSKIEYSPADVSTVENISEKETELITSLLKGNGNDSSVQAVLDLHKKFSAGVSVPSSSERDSVTWTIDHIEFRNIFSYGNDVLNRVDFNDGITGILGENAIGKSSILNTILYGLFGNVYRSQSYTNKNIISKYSIKQPLFVKISIEMGATCHYVIEREAKNKKRANGIGMEETVRFYSDQGGNIKELNLATKTETEASIKSKLSLLNKQEFILTNLLSNVSYGFCSLLSMSNAQLEETFEALFDLEKYSLLHADAKSEFKGLSETARKQKDRIAFLEGQIEGVDIDKIEDDLEMANKKLKAARGNLKTNADTLETIDRAIVEASCAKKSLQSLQSKHQLLESIQRKQATLARCQNIEALLPRKEAIERELAEKNDENAEYSKFLAFKPTDTPITSDIASLQMKIALLEEKRQVIESVPEFSEDYMKAKKFLKNLSKESTSGLDLTKILTQIKQLEMNDMNCYSLPAAVRDSIVSDLSTKMYIDPTELLRYKKLVSDKEERDRKIHDNIVNEENINAAKKRLREKKIQTAHSMAAAIKSLELDLKYISLHESISVLEKDLEYLEQNKKTNDLVSEKAGVVEESKKISKTIESLLVVVNDFERDIAAYDKAYSELLLLDESLKPKNKELKDLKTYLDIVHPKKLPKIIIKDTITRICTEANKIIYNMTGMQCLIEEVNDKWEISLKKNQLCLGPESCSGYERFIINTGLKLGLDKFKHLSSVKMFLIDEMIDCVSGENIEKVYDLFDILKKQYKKVIVISHNEELKKKVEFKIDIRQDKKSSYIY